tara:strand:- start:6160 stop:6345 length:186 start_codon:yes stop_codon:yes gene_type:complete
MQDLLLLDNKKGNSYFTNKEAKAIEKIFIKGILHFIILNKRDALTLFKLKEYRNYKLIIQD